MLKYCEVLKIEKIEIEMIFNTTNFLIILKIIIYYLSFSMIIINITTLPKPHWTTNYKQKHTSNQQVTIAIFMVLSKAFDTVDKTILQQKLTEVGLNEYSAALIDSYMSSRKFCVNNDTTYFDLYLALCFLLCTHL